jgi:hypothetical protein
METWKILDRIPFYEVSDHGKVRSIRNKKLLKPSGTKQGYQLVSLWDGKKRHTSYVHRLVAELYAEEVNLGLVINHLDKDVRHNSITNLEWVTPTENARHREDPERYMLFKKLASLTNSMSNKELQTVIDNVNPAK